jgi:hypothetical protein
VKSEQEIEDYLSDRLPVGADDQNNWPGMTYEQGVEAALLWVIGVTDAEPLETS